MCYTRLHNRRASESSLKKKLYQNSEMIRLWTTVIVRVIFLLVGLLIAGWLLYQLRALFLLLILSIFFCYLVAPVVHLLEQPLYIFNREIRLRRSVAIAFVYVMIGALMFLGFRMMWAPLWDQINELAKNMPAYIKSATDASNNVVNGANSWMRHLRLPPASRDYLLDHIKDIAGGALPWFEGVVGRLVGL